MLSAPRQSTRRPRCSPRRHAPAPAHPGPRLPEPGAGFTIEWDVRVIYDFLFSLSEDAGSTEDLPAADREWLTMSQAAITGDAKDDLEAVFASEMAIFVAAFAVEHPELRTIDEFIDAVERTPTPDLVGTILCDLARDPEIGGFVEQASTGDRAAMDALRDAMLEHKTGFQALLADPEAGQRRVVRVLRSWAVFAAIEPRISAIIERDHALRAGDRGAYQVEAHRADDRWHPLAAGARHPASRPCAVLLRRPYNFLLAGDDWRFFGYPVADDALDADDRLAPPPADHPAAPRPGRRDAAAHPQAARRQGPVPRRSPSSSTCPSRRSSTTWRCSAPPAS